MSRMWFFSTRYEFEYWMPLAYMCIIYVEILYLLLNCYGLVLATWSFQKRAKIQATTESLFLWINQGLTFPPGTSAD